jgi:hypothetical protein
VNGLFGLCALVLLTCIETPTPAVEIWRPAPETDWQWQLTTPVDQSVDVPIYDIDLFENDAFELDAARQACR